MQEAARAFEAEVHTTRAAARAAQVAQGQATATAGATAGAEAQADADAGAEAGAEAEAEAEAEAGLAAAAVDWLQGFCAMLVMYSLRGSNGSWDGAEEVGLLYYLLPPLATTTTHLHLLLPARGTAPKR